MRTLSIDLQSATESDDPDGAGTGFAGDQEHSRYAVTLDYPESPRLGDTELVHLQIHPIRRLPGEDASGAANALQKSRSGDDSDLAVAIQARLELGGATVVPDGDITTPWALGEGASFLWTIRPADAVTLRGTAWAFLIPAASQALGGDRLALSAQPLEIHPRTIVGVSGPTARFTGSALMILGCILGVPWLDRIPKPGRRRNLGEPE